jgi:thiamine-phosphate pyrophosphorylase
MNPNLSHPDLSIYLVTDAEQARTAGHDLVDLVVQAVEGGVTAVQVREKSAPAGDFLDTVLRIADVLPSHVELIVNDRVDVFLAARLRGARVTGVHVGQSDLPVAEVRRMIGPDALLGLSASLDEQIRDAQPAVVVDYIGIGALHTTTTKLDAPPPLGHAEFARLARLTTLPAVAIGGVTAHDLPMLRASGAAGGAVVSAICAAADPRAAAEELARAWEAGL